MALKKITPTIGKALLIFFAATSFAFADVSLIIEEAVGGAGEFTGSGHASLHLSGICAETPVQLRLCKEGEDGVVLITYPQWGQDVPYKWLALSWKAFLYGVEDESKIPIYANGEVRRYLREEYRKAHWQGIVADTAENTIPAGRWTEPIGAVINRDIYALTVKTTPQQDVEFLERFNQIPNVYSFNTAFDNCADFVRETINLIFPKATHRDFLNDFGMTTPKALARSFTEFASLRPGLLFRIERFPQIDGPVRRSMNNRNFTEKALVSKKYALTMLTTKPEVYGAFAVTYLLTGWYNLNSEYHKVPALEVAELKLSATQPYQQQVLLASTNPTAATISVRNNPKLIERRVKEFRADLFGSKDFWNDYKKKFKPMMAKALEDKLFLDEAEVQTFFKDLELQSVLTVDGDGRMMLRVDDRGVPRNLGITRANIGGPDSDPILAYKLMLAKVDYMLSAPGRNRLIVPEFEKEWELLQAAAAKFAQAGLPGYPPQLRFRQTIETVSGSKKAQKFLMVITH